MFLSERTVWPYRYRRGSSPLIVSMPHAGTFIPWSIGRGLSECAARRPDTDWHLPRLHDFVEAFDQQPLYRAGAPDDAEIGRRLETVWRPYHRRIEREIERVRSEHGVALLWDAHSITSEVPRLFPGRLPDFNLGTADNTSCDPGLAEALAVALRRHTGYTSVLNGRFKGGYITRRYGRPAEGVQAIQLEMAEAVYMEERCPYAFRDALADRVRPILREQLETALEWVEGRARAGQPLIAKLR
jgi:N-formylglutamate deformylase